MFNVLVNLFTKTGHDCAPGAVKVLVPWYEYLDDLDAQCNIKEFQVLGANSDIPLILLAIIDDLIRVAGLIAVGFIIYGAVMYVTSQGDPQQAAKAQGTIINALIGLVIAIVAVAFVSFLGGRL